MGAESSTMQNAATSCKGCKNLGDKQIDTVKLDMEKLSAAGKENSDPGQMRDSPAQKNQGLEQERKAGEQEVRRRAEEARKLEEQRQREQRQREEEEAARIVKEEEARRVELARITAQKRRQAEEEERLRRQRQKEEEEASQRKEEEEAAEARRVVEEEEARKRERLGAFLEKAGCKAVNEKKVKKGMISSGFFYPLHAAVEQKDAEAIELLLWAGADPCLTNSKKLNPLKLAQAKNKQGSHEKVMAALAA